MQELIFQVEFLSDIVLPATSNTEGNIQQLDFIAGSNFLGMVAREYNKFDDSFGVFHSGAVRFGDATLLHNDKPTYKMPLSYFYKKGEEKTLYNHHLIEDFKQFDQLKQKRNGYITKDLEVVYIEYNYSQKSAYDKTKRTSLEGSMFGYSAMKQGLKWQFSIKIDDAVSPNDVELLKKTIVGQKRLGKSKSAQYGLVEIVEKKGNVENIEDTTSTEMILYVNSRLALVDECGNPTYDLKYLCDELKDTNIDYAKCQIKTSTFTPYNGARETKDYERVVINKGSVIALKDISPEHIEVVKKGVGAYLAEGFGEVLINPSFLNDKKFKFDIGSEASASPKGGAKAPNPKTSLGIFLQQREDKKQDKLTILNQVDKFISDYKEPLYKNIKPSQWGKIRSICTSGEENFRDEIREYISNGVKAWSENQINTLLDKEEYSLEFIKLISVQMPKAKDTKKESKNEN